MRWQDLVRKTYALCISRSDNVYTRPDAAETKCYYTKGTCSDGSTGCVFGQLLRDEFDLIAVDTWSGDNSISAVIRDNIPNAPFAVRQWCSHIQIVQDEGRPWGNALGDAEDYYGLQVDDLLRENP